MTRAMEKDVISIFRGALIDNDLEILKEAHEIVDTYCYNCYRELTIKESGINIRTGKPYKPATIKACKSALEKYHSLKDDCRVAINFLWGISRMEKKKKWRKSKGKVIQLNNYQGQGTQESKG